MRANRPRLKANRAAPFLRAACASMLVVTVVGCEPDHAAARVGTPTSTLGTIGATAGALQMSDADVGVGIYGTVVDFVTSRPLADRTVVVGGRKATTDASGRFALSGVPPTYDAIVVEPDGTTVSVYERLSRRDPVFGHPRSDNLESPLSDANIAGTVWGGGAHALGSRDKVTVYFFSPQADAREAVSGTGSTAVAQYGPLSILWSGPRSIAGLLLALGTFVSAPSAERGDAGAQDRGQRAWVAKQPITLSAGQVGTVNMALSPVEVRHISARTRIPNGSVLVEKDVLYRVPIVHGLMHLAGDTDPHLTFDCMVPDPGVGGGQFCAQATTSPIARTLVCGIAPDAPSETTLTVQEPPSLVSPTDGIIATRYTQFQWSPFDGGIHVLELRARTPDRSTPTIHVFTASTGEIWPDLGSLGLLFPTAASYTVSVEGLGPYATMDEALGPEGIGAPFPAERRSGMSASIGITTGP